MPLSKTNGWQFLKYRKIPSNIFHNLAAGLQIAVTNSAAPAVFRLPQPLQVTGLQADGYLSGSLRIPSDKQGEKGFDDYAVRIGLVESGSHTLNWRERIGAADWVKKLFALAPNGTGISKIHFSNVGTDAKQMGRTRTHPMSDLIEETVVAVPDPAGHFTFTSHFHPPLNVIAVWICCDGDDTQSSFAVLLNKLELETHPP